MLKSEADDLLAAHALASHPAQLPPLPPLLPAKAPDDAQPSDNASGANGVSVETRRERKALAAKAARKRARERLASLEYEAAVLRRWLADAMLQMSCSIIRPPSPTDTTPSETAACDSSSTVPPKKRRLDLVSQLLVEPLD
jgi:hypothetical protein